MGRTSKSVERKRLCVDGRRQDQWKMMIPYYDYCESCNTKNYRYGQLLYGKSDDVKLTNINWTKDIEKTEY